MPGETVSSGENAQVVTLRAAVMEIMGDAPSYPASKPPQLLREPDLCFMNFDEAWEQGLQDALAAARVQIESAMPHGQPDGPSGQLILQWGLDLDPLVIDRGPKGGHVSWPSTTLSGKSASAAYALLFTKLLAKAILYAREPTRWHFESN